MDIDKEYTTLKPYYESLQQEVLSILEQADRDKNFGVDIHIITPRTGIKELDSIKKHFNSEQTAYKGHPISSIADIGDIAGVRVVCYCIDHQRQLGNFLKVWEKFLENSFGFVEVDPKFEEAYRAIHVNVSKSYQLEDKSRKKLTCEIQIRTVLQDAWAKVDEHYLRKIERVEEEGKANLRKSISDILYGCEDLWILFRDRNK